MPQLLFKTVEKFSYKHKIHGSHAAYSAVPDPNTCHPRWAPDEDPVEPSLMVWADRI
jgi:hypothetical protein